jgi:hypothetical protein
MKQQLKQIIDHNWFFPVLLLNYGLFYILFQEKYPANNGFGTDGYVYLTFVTDFTKSPFFDSYYIHRVFPSFTIRAVLSLFSLELSPVNVFNSYEVLNLLSIVCSAYFIKKILLFLNIGFKNQLLAFTLLFVNFALLKWPFYFPVMTDTIAFALSIMLLYFYLKNNIAGVVLITILLAFTWPMGYYQGLLLIAFPYKRIEYLSLPLFSKMTVYVLSAFIFIISFILIIIIGKADTHLIYVPKIDRMLLPLSVVFAIVIYLGYGKLFLNARIFNIAYFYESLKVKRIGLSVGVFLLVSFFIRSLELPVSGFYPTSAILENPLVHSLVRPLLTIVSHFTFFGVFICLLIIFWKRFAAIIGTMGWGLIGAFALNLYLYGIMPESRTLMNLFPWALVFLIYAINDLSFSNLFYVLISFLCLIISRIWLPINLEDVSLIDKNGSIDFPNQKFYMNMGPWMSEYAFYLNGIAMIISFSVIMLMLFKIRVGENGKIGFMKKF